MQPHTTISLTACDALNKCFGLVVSTSDKTGSLGSPTVGVDVHSLAAYCRLQL